MADIGGTFCPVNTVSWSWQCMTTSLIKFSGRLGKQTFVPKKSPMKLRTPPLPPSVEPPFSANKIAINLINLNFRYGISTPRKTNYIIYFKSDFFLVVYPHLRRFYYIFQLNRWWTTWGMPCFHLVVGLVQTWHQGTYSVDEITVCLTTTPSEKLSV